MADLKKEGIFFLRSQESLLRKEGLLLRNW